MSSSGASSAALSSRVVSHQRERLIEIGEALVRRNLRPAEPEPSPLGERMQRRVLQQLRGGPLDPGVRRLAEPGAKLLDEPRLAEARLADDLDELAFAAARPLEAPHQERQVVLAADERRERARPAASSGAARAHNSVERDRRRHALERMRALVLGDEEARDLPLHGGGDEDLSRFGEALGARGDVRRFAEHFARGVDHDQPRIETDAGCERRQAPARVPGVERLDCGQDGERGARRPLGVVLLARAEPNSAMIPSPSFFRTCPPYWATASEPASR